MATHASEAKIDATRAYGGEVVLTERPLVEVMQELQVNRGLAVVHPYDDLNVIAGAGTIGIELTEDVDELGCVVVPVGGGGLISGIATAVKELSPRTRVVGVEPVASDAVSQALAEGRPITLDRPTSIADGLAAAFAGQKALRHIETFVDEIVLVSEAEVEEGMRLGYKYTKLAMEPAAATVVAALATGRIRASANERVALVISGGNLEQSLLAKIMSGTPDSPMPGAAEAI